MDHADEVCIDDLVAPQSVLPSRCLSKLESVHLRANAARMAGARHEWGCVCAVLAHIDSPTLRRIQLSLWDSWHSVSALYNLPWETLDKQFTRLHRQSPDLVVMTRLIRQQSSPQTYTLRPASYSAHEDPRTIISRNLPLLCADGGRAFLWDTVGITGVVDVFDNGQHADVGMHA